MKKLLTMTALTVLMLGVASPALAFNFFPVRRSSTLNQATVYNTVQLEANTGYNSQETEAEVDEACGSEANAGGENKTITTGNATATSYITVAANLDDCSCPEEETNGLLCCFGESTRTKNRAYVDNLVGGFANTGDNEQKEEAKVEDSIMSTANASTWGTREISTGDAEAKSTLRVLTNLRVNGFEGLFD